MGLDLSVTDITQLFKALSLPLQQSDSREENSISKISLQQ